MRNMRQHDGKEFDLPIFHQKKLGVFMASNFFTCWRRSELKRALSVKKSIGDAFQRNGPSPVLGRRTAAATEEQMCNPPILRAGGWSLTVISIYGIPQVHFQFLYCHE